MISPVKAKKGKATTVGALRRETALGPREHLPAGSGYLYRNTDFVPRVNGTILSEDHQGLTVQATSDIIVRYALTQGDAWEALVDGKPAPITDIGPASAKVAMPSAGTHVVRLRYLAPGLRTGALLALGSLLAITGLLVTGRRPATS